MTLCSGIIPAWQPVLPLFIFGAELAVVTCSTLRIIFLSRGRKYLASILGFFEISVWLFAITQIMQNLSNPWCYLAFAAGFTAGNFLGVFIEEKLAIGTLVVRTITKRGADELLEGLRSAGYGVTSVEARGTTGPVDIVFTVVQRKELNSVISIIKGFDPRAFYSVDELRSASGIFPVRERPSIVGPIKLLAGFGRQVERTDGPLALR